MKKILYIIANSKIEEHSTCQRAARMFLNAFLENNPEYELETLNLYEDEIPEPNHRHFVSRAELVSGSDFEALAEKDKATVHRMAELCQLFKSADRYVIASPMWTLSFPYKLKQFLDCIILNTQTISISPKGVKGLLHDKERKSLYVQSSAAMYPFTTIELPLIGSRVNHGVTYLEDVFLFLGIKSIHPLLIQGTEIDDVGVELALLKGAKEIPRLLKEFK
ncbi:MAG TPA: flavodoxin [Firmicutes bacterium]|nr:flavodoxin [Bacillota bacterium]